MIRHTALPCTALFVLWTYSAMATTNLHVPKELLSRNTVCATGNNLNLVACSGRPFCCPAGTSCIEPIAAQNTVLCCPNGQDCTRIQPIACNMTLQDESRFPNATVHTSDLGATLATCGTACCPLGYSCVNRECILLLYPTTSLSSSSSSTTTSSSLASSTLSSSTLSSTSSSPATSTSMPNASATSTSTPSKTSHSHASTIIGVVVGMLLGAAILAGLVFFLLRRNRKKKEQQKARETKDWYQKTPPLINSPIAGPPFRNTQKSGSIVKQDNGTSIGSHEPFPRTPEPHQWMAKGRNATSPYIPTPLTTPPQRPLRSGDFGPPLRRAVVPKSAEPASPHDSYIRTSSDSSINSVSRHSEAGTIKVGFTPPPPLVVPSRTEASARYESNMTTFTGMMESAGLQRDLGQQGRSARYA